MFGPERDHDLHSRMYGESSGESSGGASSGESGGATALRRKGSALQAMCARTESMMMIVVAPPKASSMRCWLMCRSRRRSGGRR